MTLDDTKPIPLYRQLYDLLLDKIQSGEWPVDFKIPTENELCEQYNVSRMTVRLATEELKAKGYIYRKQGRGSFIKKPKIEQPLTYFYSFSDEHNDGSEVKSEVLNFQVCECPALILDKLDIQPGQIIYQIKRLRLRDGEPFAYECSYIPCTVCQGLNAEMIESNGLYNTIEMLAGFRPNTATESFEAMVMEGETAKLLGVDEGSAALHIERVASWDGTTVEYCESMVRGDRIKYHIVLK